MSPTENQNSKNHSLSLDALSPTNTRLTSSFNHAETTASNAIKVDELSIIEHRDVSSKYFFEDAIRLPTKSIALLVAKSDSPMFTQLMKWGVSST